MYFSGCFADCYFNFWNCVSMFNSLEPRLIKNLKKVNYQKTKNKKCNYQYWWLGKEIWFRYWKKRRIKWLKTIINRKNAIHS